MEEKDLQSQSQEEEVVEQTTEEQLAELEKHTEKIEDAQEVQEPTKLPVFDSAFNSRVYHETFNEEPYHDTLDSEFTTNKELEEYHKLLDQQHMYKDEVLKEAKLEATVQLKHKALKMNEQMIADIDSKLEGFTKADTTSYQTQQINEMRKQSSFIYFQSFSSVASEADLLAFAETNKDSVELLSLVLMKMNQMPNKSIFMSEAKSRVHELLDDCMGLPAQQELLEKKELLKANEKMIKTEGLMYFPQLRTYININKYLNGDFS